MNISHKNSVAFVSFFFSGNCLVQPALPVIPYRYWNYKGLEKNNWRIE